MNAPTRPGRRFFIQLVLPGSRCSWHQSKWPGGSLRGDVYAVFISLPALSSFPSLLATLSFESAAPWSLTLCESPVTSALAKSGTKLRPLSTSGDFWNKQDSEGQHASLAHLLLPLKVQSRGNVHCTSLLGRWCVHTGTHTHMCTRAHTLLQILI